MKFINFAIISFLVSSCSHNVKKQNSKAGEVMLASDISSESVGLCQEGKIDRGIEQLKKNFKQNRKSHHYWNSLAACYFYEGDFKKAEFHLNVAQEFNKANDPYLLNNQGLILYKLGHENDGIALLEQAFNKQKNNRQVALNLGQLYLHNGLYHKISDNFGPLIEKNGAYLKDQEIHAMVAIALVNLNKVDRALGIFKTLKDEQHQKAEVALFYSLALSTKGKWQDASNLIGSVSGKLSPLNEMIYNSLKIKIESNLRPRG